LGESQLANIEANKLERFKHLHNIHFSSANKIFILLQGLTLVVWAGLVQRFSFNVEDYPEMLTGGFLWFKDLSVTDPFFILPSLNVFFIFLNIYVRINLILEY
jgi:membrane protein insertase Oxa1/YidC/SpoIIIJ